MYVFRHPDVKAVEISYSTERKAVLTNCHLCKVTNGRPARGVDGIACMPFVHSMC